MRVTVEDDLSFELIYGISHSKSLAELMAGGEWN